MCNRWVSIPWDLPLKTEICYDEHINQKIREAYMAPRRPWRFEDRILRKKNRRIDKIDKGIFN